MHLHCSQSPSFLRRNKQGTLPVRPSCRRLRVHTARTPHAIFFSSFPHPRSSRGRPRSRLGTPGGPAPAAHNPHPILTHQGHGSAAPPLPPTASPRPSPPRPALSAARRRSAHCRAPGSRVAARGVARSRRTWPRGFRRVAGTCDVTARGAVAGAGNCRGVERGGGARPFGWLSLFGKCRLGVCPAGSGARPPPPGRGASRCRGDRAGSSPGSAPADLLLPLPESERLGSGARHGTLDKLMRLRRRGLRKAVSSLLQKILSVPPKYNAKFLTLAWFLKVEGLSVFSVKSHPFV